MKEVTESGHTAVILCGGRGSRMGGAAASVPKALLEVHGKPILWYIFWELFSRGFKKFILPLGYLGKQIETYITDLTDQLDCEVICKDTGVDTSIARRIHMISDFIPTGDDFFLLNSDTIFDFDLEEMLEEHRRSDALVTVSSVEVVSIWGLITVDEDGSVCGFDRQRKVRYLTSDGVEGHKGLVHSGLAWLNKEALSYADLANCGDFESTVYQRVIDEGRMSHYQIRGEWFPIDTPKDLNVINLVEEDRHGSGHFARAAQSKLAGLTNPSS